MLTIDIHEELNRIIKSIEPLAVSHNITFSFESLRDCKIKTDLIVFRRIIINMLKNAIEAEESNSQIGINVNTNKEKIFVSVQNPFIIPNHVQAQIFQRAFSTKGSGRGIGTYGMRLLAEAYLGGKVSFESCKETGTIFTLELPISNFEIIHKVN